jgi:hypothetical protein
LEREKQRREEVLKSAMNNLQCIQRRRVICEKADEAAVAYGRDLRLRWRKIRQDQRREHRTLGLKMNGQVNKRAEKKEQREAAYTAEQRSTPNKEALAKRITRAQIARESKGELN